ncbi:hypothetical protein GS597_18070 [Synechococcales cyanobacterium C]|uniref:Uncharacterized protein n=1 Tax=Petrachloros mirabilis ULC683 TaxID=2781853 RepID=A0A8K2A9L1_9CYAN|nr:hypothetical protein [Petrachloros mirabilis]NCJ08379.1 hypothetical protein [Petrachloros mirabilis ULC683]
MNDIKKVDSSQYVTVQGPYAVLNEGRGYAIIHMTTKEYLARNIESFLDCVRTLEYLSGKIPHTGDSTATVPQEGCQSNQIQTPNFGVREDVQKLIEKYAPETVRVDKEVNWNRSKYRCFDVQGNYLGKIKGKLGDRYWIDHSGQRFY